MTQGAVGAGRGCSSAGRRRGNDDGTVEVVLRALPNQSCSTSPPEPHRHRTGSEDRCWWAEEAGREDLHYLAWAEGNGVVAPSQTTIPSPTGAGHCAVGTGTNPSPSSLRGCCRLHVVVVAPWSTGPLREGCRPFGPLRSCECGVGPTAPVLPDGSLETQEGTGSRRAGGGGDGAAGGGAAEAVQVGTFVAALERCWVGSAGAVRSCGWAR